MIAIKTKLIPATDTKGTQIRATVVSDLGNIGKPVTVGYDYELGDRENHEAACLALRQTHSMYRPLTQSLIAATYTGRAEMTHLFRRTEYRAEGFQK